MCFTSNDWFQKIFFSQPTLDTLELKKDNGIDFVLLVWNKRERIILKLKALYTSFLHSIKLSRYRMGIKFDRDLSAVEQNN